MAINYGTKLNFSPFGFSGEGGGSGIPQAARTSGLAAIHDKVRGKWDPSKIYGAGQEAYGAEQRTAIEIDGQVKSAVITADAEVKAEKERRDMINNAIEDSQPGALEKGFQIVSTGIKLASLFSDKTTKNTIEEIDDALTTLRQLKPVSFYYNEDYSSNPERLHYGFVAQDYIKVMPDATYFDEPTGKLKIDTQELIGLLVRSIQQLETRITRMEAKAVLVGVK